MILATKAKLVDAPTNLKRKYLFCNSYDLMKNKRRHKESETLHNGYFLVFLSISKAFTQQTFKVFALARELARNHT